MPVERGPVDGVPVGGGRKFDLESKLQEHRNQEKKLRWRGNFSEYFDIAADNPSVSRLSHARIYDMIASEGVEVSADGVKKYKFFENELFGIDESLGQIAEYFNSAGKRSEVRKRILLLMGPPGGGKSSIVTTLKRGLERFTRADEGAAYAIEGCPMQEEPLHLIPNDLREEVEKEYNLHIEGDLCPHCRYELENTYLGVVENVPVRRFAFSEKERVGIGTFTPSDPKSQDIAELVGGINLATIGEVGSESDPRAYRFDGELNIANRGLMEFIEMLKCDEKFLYVLLSLSQEQNIKTGRFSMIYADEVVVSHTNEHEYNAFKGNKKNEALQDRIILVKVPYNLQVSKEVKIYEKLMRQSNMKGHMDPNALKIAATWAILTRLEESKKAGMSVMKKLKLYDGEAVDGFQPKDVRELKEEAIGAGDKEGMDGISPRYVVNRLASAAVRNEDVPCINTIDVLRSLRDGLDQSTSIPTEGKGKYKKFIDIARAEYDDMAKREVQRAFVYSFEENAKTLCNVYLDNVEAFCNKTKLKDPITDEDVEPDEKLMKSIEEQIGVNDNSKKAFREEIMIRISSLARKGRTFEYSSHERLKEAIEKKLFADLKDLVRVTTSTKTPDPDQKKRINEVIEQLTEKHGYCPHCANELLKYVGHLIH
ncbi:MAG: protein prkA [Candidatus Levybacteria bacterium]|nr:protein prkA [Candidatus Levybacteria bacterium]